MSGFKIQKMENGTYDVTDPEGFSMNVTDRALDKELRDFSPEQIERIRERLQTEDTVNASPQMLTFTVARTDNGTYDVKGSDGTNFNTTPEALNKTMRTCDFSPEQMQAVNDGIANGQTSFTVDVDPGAGPDQRAQIDNGQTVNVAWDARTPGPELPPVKLSNPAHGMAGGVFAAAVDNPGGYVMRDSTQTAYQMPEVAQPEPGTGPKIQTMTMNA